ncbi:hypothetical protein [Jannaschia pohangensis]|uniref:Uncharacterized protein n=1 Tax=Jannaschia pohangensis TaxID=390807 RepID=A0A1I3JSD9_9RHOB|nr:hypothetical protein [Jannaschia pohangensis]SFI63171.1 hypothetical protein SAMN04488095_1415 [Jannaschia pohangensis]
MSQLPPPSPSTSRLLTATVIWQSGCLAIVVGLYLFLGVAGVGSVVTVPTWYLVLAWALAILTIPPSLFALSYSLSRSARAISLPAIGFSSVLLAAMTLGAFAWALPLLSTFVVSAPQQIEMRVTGTQSLLRRYVGCADTVSFGHWYRPGGKVCVPTATSLYRGTMFGLEGAGNTWAMRVTRVTSGPFPVVNVSNGG